jgi:hypothetical protein
MTNGQSASLSWYKAPIWGLRPDLYFCQTFADLLVWGALSDERTGLSLARVTVSSNEPVVKKLNYPESNILLAWIAQKTPIPSMLHVACAVMCLPRHCLVMH